MSETNKKEKRVYTDIEKCKRTLLTIRIAALSIVFAFLSLISYEIAGKLDGLPSAVFYNGAIVNDTFLLFIVLGLIAILLSIIGLVLSLTRRSIIGFILSSIIPFTIIAFSAFIPEMNLTELLNSIEVQDRSYVAPIEVLEGNITIDSNTTV